MITWDTRCAFINWYRGNNNGLLIKPAEVCDDNRECFILPRGFENSLPEGRKNGNDIILIQIIFVTSNNKKSFWVNNLQFVDVDGQVVDQCSFLPGGWWTVKRAYNNL